MARTTTVRIDAGTLKAVAALSGFMTAALIAALMNKRLLTQADVDEMIENLRSSGPGMNATICNQLADGLTAAVAAASVKLH